MATAPASSFLDSFLGMLRRRWREDANDNKIRTMPRGRNIESCGAFVRSRSGFADGGSVHSDHERCLADLAPLRSDAQRSGDLRPCLPERAHISQRFLRLWPLRLLPALLPRILLQLLLQLSVLIFLSRLVRSPRHFESVQQPRHGPGFFFRSRMSARVNRRTSALTKIKDCPGARGPIGRIPARSPRLLRS